jgi:hypothetical protein
MQFVNVMNVMSTCWYKRKKSNQDRILSACATVKLKTRYTFWLVNDIKIDIEIA